MTTCSGCEPLQHKWIKIWSQWSFEWLSLRKNMTENKASAQTPHYIEQNHKKKKNSFSVSVIIYYYAFEVYVFPCFLVHPPITHPLKPTFNIKSHKTQRQVCCTCLSADDEGHFEPGGRYPDTHRPSCLSARLRLSGVSHQEEEKWSWSGSQVSN